MLARGSIVGAVRICGVIVSLLGLSMVVPASHAENEGLRTFTIRDSIEISYFVNPTFWSVNHDRPTAPIVSPDRRWLLVITQRGVLSSNRLESTIWVLDRQAVSDFLSNKSVVCPEPRAIATFQAISSNPVISDVRWLAGSRRIAFLAKEDGRYPQLFVVDSATEDLKRITNGDQYVSAYDISGDTIAYATLDLEKTPESQPDLLPVTGQSIWALLWRDRPIGDRDDGLLLNIPNKLHVLRNGRELSTSFTMDARPLNLFYPVLALSPDRESLITIAPFHNIPSEWTAYQPRHGYEFLKLTPDNKALFEEENDWKPSVVVRVDLRSGVATPLLDAPAGRSLALVFAPTKVIWSADSQSVLISNIFLPLQNAHSSGDAARAAAPAVAIIDVATHGIQLIAYLEQPAGNTVANRQLSDITWDQKKNQVEFVYASSPDNVPIAFHETYRLAPAGWVKVETPSGVSPHDVELSVDQNLNQPPILAGHSPNAAQVPLVWDPNPQLKSIALGKASLYQWKDNGGNFRTGILVLPADYVRGKRYPLVLQTHGYEPKKFFVDGTYTTGSGGRALAGRGIIVLQMDQPETHLNTPQEGPFQTDGFSSAIEHLAADGLVDPDRVGVIGFSFTVYHVLYAITHKPDLFAVAAITDGNDLSYWLYLTWTDIPYAQQWAENTNGGVKPFGKEGLLRWAESAPGFNLDRVKTPLMISCLEKGTLVTTWDIYGGLRTLNKPVELQWLRREDAPHVLVQPRHRYLSQEGAVDWFDFWLNGHEDPDPAKGDQYARWRELRKLEQSQQKQAAFQRN